MAEVFIGFGSNMEDRQENCSKGIKEIKKRHTILSLSSAYQAEPWGKKDQTWFLNGAMKISTRFTPTELLEHLKAIEEGIGRKEGIKWGPRPIDLDILFYDKEVINLPDLVIPHPLAHKRRFVLAPLVEIEPEFIHPLLKVSVKSLLEKVADDSTVIRLEGTSWQG